MKKSLRYFFLSSTVFLLLILSVSIVYGMEVSSVKGTIANGDVSHDFGNAILKVSPEKSLSFNYEHTQVLSITNKNLVDLYFFIDPYFKNDLRNIQLRKVDYVAKQTEAFRTCNAKSVDPTEACYDVPSQTYHEATYSNIVSTTKDWGGEKHYVGTTGTLIKAGMSQSFEVKYKVTDKEGKWNARIWASTNNDYSCILDDQKTCSFDYTIDPTYDLSNMTVNMSVYYKLDDGAGNYALNSNSTTNGNRLLKGSATQWNTSGVINGSASFYITANSYFVNTSATSLPNTQGWVNMWYKPPLSATTTTRCILSLSDGSDTNRMLLTTSDTSAEDIVTYIIVGGSNKKVITCTKANHHMDNNTWNMLTFWWDTATDNYYLYVNGTNVSGCTFLTQSNLPAQTTLALGASNGLTNNNGGGMDEIGIWYNRPPPNSNELAGLFNNGSGCSYPFNCYVPTSTDNFTITTSTGFSSPVVETSNTNYYVNFSYHNLNISNVSNVTFNIDYLTTGVTATQISNGSSGNTSWQYFGVTNQRPTLNPSLATTPYYLNFTYNANFVNGTINYTSTTNQTQNVTMTYLPINIFIETPIIETSTTQFNTSYNISGGNTSEVSFVYITAWNSTNVTGTHIINNTNQINSTFSYTTPLLNGADLTRMFNITPYLNITFNGSTVSRNGTSGIAILQANQMVWRMLLDNCTNASINVSVINFSIQDTNGSIVPSADLTSNYTVYVTNPANSRNYGFYDVNTATPKLCSYTNFGTMYLNWVLNYTGDGGRVGNSVKTSQAITNSSYNYTLYFVGQYTIRLFNESDNSIFDPAITTSTTLNVYCANSTEETVLNTSTQGVTIYCSDWQFMRVYVVMNNETYYRTLQPTWYNATNSSTTIDWFLIDLDIDTAVRKIFTLNDLGGQYHSGYLKVQKIIGTSTQTIHQESWDVENKVQAYFILNDLYSLTITDNTNNTHVLGNFLADTTSEHEITAPEIPFQPDQTIDDFQWRYLYNELGGWLYMQYQSLNGTTYNVTYLIVNNTNESQVFLNVSFNTATGSANYTSMLNGSIYKTYLSFNHSSYSWHLDTKLWGVFKLADDFLSGLSDPVGFKKWFAFIIIIVSGLLFSGLSITAGAVTMTTMTWFFYVLGWLNLTVGIVPGSVILGLFTLITIGVLFVGEGIR